MNTLKKDWQPSHGLRCGTPNVSTGATVGTARSPAAGAQLSLEIFHLLFSAAALRGLDRHISERPPPPPAGTSSWWSGASSLSPSQSPLSTRRRRRCSSRRAQSCTALTIASPSGLRRRFWLLHLSSVPAVVPSIHDTAGCSSPPRAPILLPESQEYDEYFKRAKMLTEIHAKNEKRAMANTTNVMAAGEGAGAAGAGAGGDMPSPKKARQNPTPHTAARRLRGAGVLGRSSVARVRNQRAWSACRAPRSAGEGSRCQGAGQEEEPEAPLRCRQRM